MTTATPGELLALADECMEAFRNGNDIRKKNIALRKASDAIRLAAKPAKTIPEGFCSPGGKASCLHLHERERCSNCPVNEKVDNDARDRFEAARALADKPADEGVREATIEECEIAARGPVYKTIYNGADGHNWSRDSDYGRGRHAAADAVAALSEPKPTERVVAHEDCLNCRCPPDERCRL